MCYHNIHIMAALNARHLFYVLLIVSLFVTWFYTLKSSFDIASDVDGNLTSTTKEVVFVHTTKHPVENQNTCPNGTILSISPHQAIGDSIWQYLSVKALSHLHPNLHLVPYLPESTKTHLEEMFEPLEVPSLASVPHRCLDGKYAKYLYSTDAVGTSQGSYVVLEVAELRLAEVLSYGIAKLMKLLRFRKEYLDVAQEYLHSLKGLKLVPTYVALHYEGDGNNYLSMYHYDASLKQINHKYYMKAMQYFKDRHDHVIFVLVTGDDEWVKKNLRYLQGEGNVVQYKGSKVMEMTVLAQCNHTILSYGTYGSAVAVLTGGTAVAYDTGGTDYSDGTTLPAHLSRRLGNWVAMK